MGTFALGCAQLSIGGRWPSRSTYQPFGLLDAAFEGQCRTFDTAAAYGWGQSDRALGAWMASRRTRDEVVIVAKGGHPDDDWRPRLDPAALRADLEASLRRLRTDWVDYYLLHRDDPALSIGRTMETLHQFVQDGKVRAIGASNWTHARIEEANQFAARHGLTTFTVSSPHLSLAEMKEPPWPGCVTITGEAGEASRTWYATTGMPVLAWSPLSGGTLTDATSYQSQASCYGGDRNEQRRQRLHALAAIRGHSPAQVALAYLLRQSMRVIPVVSASTPGRFRELLTSTKCQLTSAEVEWLEAGTVRPEGAVW